jgi:hypothetical protein
MNKRRQKIGCEETYNNPDSRTIHTPLISEPVCIISKLVPKLYLPDSMKIAQKSEAKNLLTPYRP